MLTNVLISVDLTLLAEVDSYVSKKRAAAHAQYKARLAAYNSALKDYELFKKGTEWDRELLRRKHDGPPPKPVLPKKENINRSTITRLALQAYIAK